MKVRFIKFVVLVSITALFIFSYFHFSYNKVLPVLKEVKSFELESAFGGTYQWNNDKVKVVSFFYTRCPDVCPLTMIDMAKIQEELKKDSLFVKKVELVSITIDPENDRMETIRSYSEGFGADTEGWHWLRGSHEETKKVTEDFQMSKKEMHGFVAHNTTMYLLDRENQIRALHDMAKPGVSVDTDKILDNIYMLINE